MWEVSDRFLNALRGPHQTVTVVDVLDQGVTVKSAIAVVSGTLTRDRRAENYGRLSCVVADPVLAPKTAASELGPAGFELQLYRGIRFADGTTEQVPLGIFPIQDAQVDGVGLTTSIEAVDRSQRVADALLETNVSFSSGHGVGLAALSLVQGAIPDVEFAGGVDLGTGGRVVYESGSDRWAIVQDMCRSNGAEVYFDGLGRCTTRLEPDVTTAAPVWTIDEGEDGVLVSVDVAWSRRPAFNRVIVTGTNQEFGVTYRGVATDNSQVSPSYYSGGRFGPKPLFHFSPHVTSTAGAQAAAKSILRAKQGVAMSLNLSAVPNVALEPGDVVLVKRAALELDMPVVLDSITVGLGPEDPMTASVRARQEDDIETS